MSFHLSSLLILVPNPFSALPKINLFNPAISSSTALLNFAESNDNPPSFANSIP